MRSMELHNRVLLQKSAWRFITSQLLGAKKVSFKIRRRVRALTAKYKVGSYFVRYALAVGNYNARWSFSWRGLVSACKSLAAGLKVRIGDGESTSFWYDRWLDEPLVDSLTVVPDHVSPQTLVSQYISEGLLLLYWGMLIVYLLNYQWS